jgi:hypothetical protein
MQSPLNRDRLLQWTTARNLLSAKALLPRWLA